MVSLLFLCAVQMATNGLCYAKDEVQKTPATYKKEVKALLNIPASMRIDLNKNKNLLSADKLTTEALNKYPVNSIAHEIRGMYYAFLGSYDDDGRKRPEYRNHKPTEPTARSKDDYKKARFHLIKALNYDKGNISARHQMLNVETQLKEYSSALIYCNELLEVAPYDSTLWKRKIFLYHQLGNDVEADRLAKRYMSIYPNDEKFRIAEADRKESYLKNHKVIAGSQREKELREMIDLNPKRPVYYYYLMSFLSANGRLEEAAEVAAVAANMCKGQTGEKADGVHVNRQWFIKQHVNILCDLNRTKEAENYLLNLRREGSYSDKDLLTSVRLNMARSAKFNDPYEANVYIYEETKSADALHYLINTAIQRGYYDDALAYLKKVKNPGQEMKLKEYVVHKRMGNTSKAIAILTPKFLASLPKSKRHDYTCDLMQYKLREAKEMMEDGKYLSAIDRLESLLETDITGISLATDDDILAYQESAWANLYTCYMERKNYTKAGNALDMLYKKYRTGDETDYVLKRADLYVASDSIIEALEHLSQYIERNPNGKTTLARSAYEEIAVPHIKRLIDSKRMKEAERCDTIALSVCPDNLDLLTYGVNIAQTLNDTTLLAKRIDAALDKDRNNRFFTIKKAQLLQSRKQYQDAMATVAPLFDTYYGDSTIIGVYAENCYLQTDTLLKLCKKDPKNINLYLDSIVSVHHAADTIIPGNKLLAKSYGRYYESMSKWGNIKQMLCYKDSAYNSYQDCKSEFDSSAEYVRISNQLYNDSRHNELSFEYQHGISGEDATRTGTAYMSYKRITDKGNQYSLGFAYAGRSGQVGSKLTDYTGGGIGFQLYAGVSHDFNRSFTGEVQVAWASRYFPSIMAKLGATWHLDDEWDVNLHASYRRMEIYSGVYRPSGLGSGYEIDYWSASKAALWQFGASVAKMLGEQFRLSAGADGFLMNSAFYGNGNVKCQYYPLEGSKNHFFVSGGLGTAPDDLLLDKANSVNFQDINGFVSMGGYLLLTQNIGLGLSGTWNTIYVRTERPSMTITPFIMNGYKNYFYVNANVVIKF